MAESIKVLGQINPIAGVLTTAYTAPNQAVVSSLSICNQSATPTTFRVSIAVAGAADDPKQYLYYDVPLSGNATFIATIGVTLGATDVIRVQSGGGVLSFNFFGSEVS